MAALPFVMFYYHHTNLPWQQSSWGQHGAHLRPVGPRWAPCWPHELGYLGVHEHWLQPMPVNYATFIRDMVRRNLYIKTKTCMIYQQELSGYFRVFFSGIIMIPKFRRRNYLVRKVTFGLHGLTTLSHRCGASVEKWYSLMIVVRSRTGQ